MAELTATIITHNEEHTIRACLESVAWAKEIVVVDSGSSDRTLEICRGYTDKVVINPWVGFIEQKNFAVSLATYDWILNIDADERVPEELRRAIERELCAPRYDGYRMARRNYFLGRWMRHGGWYPDRVLRLFDRRKGRFGGINPHACLVMPNGAVGSLDGDLIHLTYRDVSQYIRKQDAYTGTSVEERARTRRSGPVGRAELMLRPLVKFVQVYLLKRGFLDGMQGLIAALGAAYFNFVKYTKMRALGHDAPLNNHLVNPISEYLRRMDRDSTIAEAALEQEGRRTGPLDLLVRPLFTFLQACLRRGDILEGRRGLTMAGLHAGATFAAYAKLWERHRLNREVEW
ncbi:MAG: glycosyltransferase family 2 protein [candidate division NC10 bacterium]|nr:glycosyltransferase family 2 protein [candidate division NC10 bacterium]